MFLRNLVNWRKTYYENDENTFNVVETKTLVIIKQSRSDDILCFWHVYVWFWVANKLVALIYKSSVQSLSWSSFNLAL